MPRGGEITWHGPGQAVLYPIVHLRQAGLGPRRYVECLEQAMVHMHRLALTGLFSLFLIGKLLLGWYLQIQTAAEYGIEARAGATGETG